MAIKVERKKSSDSLLNVPTNFGTLLDIEPDGTFVYEFYYTAATYDILRDKESDGCIEIIVHKELPEVQKPTIRKINKPGNLKALTKDILKSGSTTKDLSRKIDSKIITRVDSDLTAKLNNETTTMLARNVPIANLSPKQHVIDVVSVADLAEDNNDAPILQTTVLTSNQAATQQETKNTSIGLLHSGIDPSRMYSTFRCITGVHTAFAGTTKSFSNSHSEQDRPSWMSTTTTNHLAVKQQTLVNSVLKATPMQLTTRTMDPKTLVPVVAFKPMRYFRYEKVVRIPKDRVENDDFYVEFRLKGEDGRIREKIIRRLPHANLLRYFATPRRRPDINIAPYQFHGRNVIEVTQLDDRAVAVRMFRRTHKRTNLDMMNNQYQQIAEIPLRKEDGLIKFVDITNNFNVIQYRAIAIGPSGFIGSGFDNVVAQAVRIKDNEEVKKRIRAVSMSTENVPGGVSVDISNVPQGVVAIAILRRDMTLNETELHVVEVDDNQTIKLVTHGLADVDFLDEDVKDDHIYEYSCRLYYEDGVELQASVSSIHVYQTVKIGEADIEVDGPDIVERGQFLDVQFGVRSVLKETNLDSVKLALERQGLDALFGFDLGQERDKLQKLIAHSVRRINLVTGEQESFGTFTGDVFSDRAEGIKALVKPPQPGHRYRYIINTLLRSPETMFDDFEKEARDESTGRAYTYKPAKFRHPISLNKGTIVNRQTLTSNHPEDDFAFGMIGNTTSIDVEIPHPKIALRDVSATKVDNRDVCVKWTVDGPKNNVEHYVVVKELLGMKTIAGKAHHISSTSTFEFVDRLEPDDVGEVKYTVLPIMNDYSREPLSIPASIVVRDGRTRGGW